MNPLGRQQPSDWDHLVKYPLHALEAVEEDEGLVDLRPTHVPVAIGVNWYTAFDGPVAKASGGSSQYWIAGDRSLGSIRGGHCVCLEPAPDDSKGRQQDNIDWYRFYNQGQEGACEGFGHSRMMSILNRHRYDAWWLYDQARLIDGDSNPNHEGTTNRAVLEVLRTTGHVLGHGSVAARTDETKEKPDKAQGIAAYRWARTVEEVLEALGTPGADHVVLLNSWGIEYPHRVYMGTDILDRLLNEAGEAGVVTDR